MNNIEFNLTKEEAQIIVDALTTLPYNQVYNLIPKLIDQARENSDPDDRDGDS